MIKKKTTVQSPYMAQDYMKTFAYIFDSKQLF